MSFGKPIKPVVNSETLRKEFEREVPATDGKFVLSRYQGMRVLNTETQRVEYMPRGNLKFSDFVNKQYYYEPYPVPIAIITTQPSSLSVFQNTGSKQFRVDAQYGFQSSAYPRYRPTPKEYGSITWEKSIDNGTSWVTVTTGVTTDNDSDTPNYSILTVSSDPGISGALFRARVTATLLAEDDQDLNDPTPPIITVGSSEQLSDAVSITTKLAPVTGIGETQLDLRTQLANQTTTILLSNTGEILRNGKATFSFDYNSNYPVQHPSRTVTAESTTVVFEASANLGATWFELDSANSLPVGVLSYAADRKSFTLSDIDSTTISDTVFRAHVTMSQTITNPAATITKTITTRVATLRVLESSEQAPVYSMTPDDVTITEGGIATFTVTSQRHRTGTLYWGISGTAASDFENATGSFIAPFNGTSTFEIEASSDLITEPNETFRVYVYTDSARTNSVVSSRVILQDTTPVYGITPADEVITEGDSITFSVAGTNAAYSTLDYEITEVADFVKKVSKRQTDENGNARFSLASKIGTVPDGDSKDYTVTVKEGTRVVAQTTLTVNDYPDQYPTVWFGSTVDASGTVYYSNSGYPDYDDVLDTAATVRPGLNEWDPGGQGVPDVGYYVTGSARYTILEESYQWEYLTPDGKTGDWTGTQTNSYAQINATDTTYNGWKFRMRVYAKVESIDGDITEITQYSGYAKATIKREDQPAPVARLIDFTVDNTYTEGDDVYFKVETDNLSGATAVITCDNGPLSGLDKEITIDRNIETFFIRSQDSDFLNSETSTVECYIDGVGSLSVDVTVENDPGTISAGISPTSIDEGDSVRISASGTNLSDTEIQWSVSAPAGLVNDTSGTFDLAFVGNSSNGKYTGSVTISTNRLTTEYTDKTMTVTATHAGSTLVDKTITVKNIDKKPPPPLPPAITAFSISPVGIITTSQTGSGKSTATVTGGTAPYTYEWSYYTNSASTYTSATTSPNGSYCTVSVSSANNYAVSTLSGTLSCTVTDANGLTRSSAVTVSASVGKVFISPDVIEPEDGPRGPEIPGSIIIIPPYTPPYTPPPALKLSIDSIRGSAKVKYGSGSTSSAADSSQATASGGVAPYTYSWSFTSRKTSTFLTTGGVYAYGDKTIGTISTKSSASLTSQLPDTTATETGIVKCTVTDAAGSTASASSTYSLSISVFGTVPPSDPPPADPPEKVVDDTVNERTGRYGGISFSLR